MFVDSDSDRLSDLEMVDELLWHHLFNIEIFVESQLRISIESPEICDLHCCFHSFSWSSSLIKVIFMRMIKCCFFIPNRISISRSLRFFLYSSKHTSPRGGPHSRSCIRNQSVTRRPLHFLFSIIFQILDAALVRFSTFTFSTFSACAHKLSFFFLLVKNKKRASICCFCVMLVLAHFRFLFASRWLPKFVFLPILNKASGMFFILFSKLLAPSSLL